MMRKNPWFKTHDGRHGVRRKRDKVRWEEGNSQFVLILFSESKIVPGVATTFLFVDPFPFFLVAHLLVKSLLFSVATEPLPTTHFISYIVIKAEKSQERKHKS